MQAVLKIHGQDRPGIVSSVAQLIFEAGGNILDAQQHREHLDNQFFMYVRFDVAEMDDARSAFESRLTALAGSEFVWSLTYSDRRKQMAIMVSKYDHCLYDLLLRHKYGELEIDIPLIISNHPDLRHVADHFGVAYHHIPRNRDNRESADAEALDLCKGNGVDFIALARYMQILTHVLLDAYPDRIINVHHGFLPAFKGAKPYHQAYARGVKIVGATSHYATEDLDMGPIIAQETEKVHHGFGPDDMIRIGRSIETRVLAAAVKAHAEDRITVFSGRTIVFD
ncbi:MAG: formyltetrahydrofolate deformylase [Rhodothermales bacterium]